MNKYYLKPETVSLISVFKDQELRTFCIKYRIDNTPKPESDNYRICNRSCEELGKIPANERQ